MIREITIENFKSIPTLKLELGRINVLIGENGCGKSNILEAIAVSAGAAQSKLDNEFLVARGIRVTETRFMHSAFATEDAKKKTTISIKGDQKENFACTLTHKSDASSPSWDKELDRSSQTEKLMELIKQQFLGVITNIKVAAELLLSEIIDGPAVLSQFLIYSPENSSLRVFQGEGQILPLGVKGEGLFAHLKALSGVDSGARLTEIMDKLALLDWFERIEIPKNLAPFERSIRIRDRYLAEGALFDQRSANEGFLFLLFYLTLFISPDTPAFFAIDNVDASLNPKLCAELMRQLVQLAEKHGKQVLFTTHNPAVLDGLNLNEDEQRLLVVHRNIDGHTKVHRVGPPKSIEGHPPMSLSQAFMRGFIGGLPENF